MSTQQRLSYDESAGVGRVVSPYLELGAYEALWMREGMTVRRIADLFRAQPEALPSDLVPEDEARAMAERVVALLREKGVERFGVRVHRAGEYPAKLREARHPVELLTFQGWWSYVEQRSVAVVGTRKASEAGRRRAAKLARALVGDGFAVVSGMAAGIDTAAHESALEAGGVTIAVIGTPLSETYPRENRELQRRIAADHLVVSQVPVWRYHQQDWRANRGWFPERNVTMSALTEATVIVEAGKTSGTLIQARAALGQGRKLFVLESCFAAGLEWPARLEGQGAVRVASYEEIRERLGGGSAHSD
ncbi:MAG TPA: DNA-processing protein DprA [Gemmatimonadales bacterium]|nr:DNA-processing protein DprA [Gemmatimonadales bacterium]